MSFEITGYVPGDIAWTWKLHRICLFDLEASTYKVCACAWKKS